MKTKTLVSYVMIFTVVLCSMDLIKAEIPRTGRSVDLSHGPLKVTPNKRFLVHEDGTPFFYLGDTAWELFHRLDRKQANEYLTNRRQKGFTVIQAVVLAELDGLNTPNAMGYRPLIDNDPAKPSEEYFKHVDFITAVAGNKGIYIGMLPTWGDKVTKAWGKGPVVFTVENAYIYGKFLGDRYRNFRNIIWILGGDRVADDRENIWRAMAKGIKDSGDKHLMTYHPQGGRSSAEWFHNDNWLDFNMLQSGHDSYDNDNYNKITTDYNRTPAKPCIDGEPRYEDHPVNWKPQNGWFNDFDVRQAAYWGVFAGGHGITYGCHDIWQMMSPGKSPISSARNNWYDVLDLPGAWDMMHIRNLMESRPFLSRIPDQSIIADQQQDKSRHIRATRGDGYIFVYTPYGDTFTVSLDSIKGDKIKAWWFDPRTGKAESIGQFKKENKKQFDPPAKPERGNDWILVIDNASKNYPPPGNKMDS